jgi:hypothetical protein
MSVLRVAFAYFLTQPLCNNLSENQRKAFRRRQQQKDDTANKSSNKCAAMSQEQLEKLASIGFSFAMKHIPFEERVQNVLEYQAHHGHVKIPWAFKTYNNLGLWWSVYCVDSFSISSC